MNEQSPEEKEHSKRLYKVLNDATLMVKIRHKIEELGIEETWKRLTKCLDPNCPFYPNCELQEHHWIKS